MNFAQTRCGKKKNVHTNAFNYGVKKIWQKEYAKMKEFCAFDLE